MKAARKIFQLTLIISIVFLSGACRKGPTDSDGYTINPNIKELKSFAANGSNNYYMAVWGGNNIYAVKMLEQFTIDNTYGVTHDTVLIRPELHLDEYVYWTYIDANNSGSKLLLVKSKYSDVSCGALYEYDVPTGQLKLLFDSTNNISSARYYHKNEDEVVFYSYGDNSFKKAGYYMFNKSTQQDSLLFPYLSSAGLAELVNGFDIHPNGEELLISISRSTRFSGNSPRLGIVSLKSQVIDTLNIEFDYSANRTSLWIRYNHDASKILYSCFPRGSYSTTVSDNSEVGIIDVATLNKIILDVNTQAGAYHESIQLAPSWSPDEQAIVFGSGDITIEGALGRRKLYILTKLE